MRRTIWAAAVLAAAVAAPGAPAWAQNAQTGAEGAQGSGSGSDAGVNGALVLGADPAAAGGAVSAGILAGRPTVSIPRTTTPPDVDGRLDDAVWRSAARITQFVQQRPAEGAPATEQTEVLIAYDSENIYFAVYAHYSDRSLIRANRSDRDQTGRDDTVRVYFDPFLDQQRAYVLSINGYGVQSDSIMNAGDSFGSFGQVAPGGGIPDAGPGVRDPGVRGFVGSRIPDPGSGTSGSFWQRLARRIQPQNHTSGGARSGLPGDASWDALFESSGRMVEDGWTAEMAIPFKSLRYPGRQPNEPHRWGFQIERTIDSKDESVVWAPVSRNVMGLLRQMGVLDGMTNLSTSRNLEFLPTFTAIRADAMHVHRDFTHDHSDSLAEGALNVKYGLTPNLVLDFTYNPDFSQIESDRPQIEVNQRFAVFYPELRPFFLEGQEIYQIEAPFPTALVHTRTLVDPRFGAKLTGKVGKTSIGFMVADDEAPGNVLDRDSPAFDRSAQVVFGRVRYDLYSESHIGAIFTDREFLDTYSRVGGLDGVFRFGANHRVSFTAINADRRNVDGRRSTGSLLDMRFRREGRHVLYEVRHNEIDPEFETDLGFVRRTDQKQSNASFSYRFWPESWIINWEPRVQYERNYDFAGVLQDEGIWGRLNFQFANNISVFTNFNRDMERFRAVDFWKTRYNYGWNMNTSRRFGFGGSVWQGDQVRFIESPFLGSDRQLNLVINVRPFSRLESEMNLNTSRFIDVRTNAEEFDIKIFRSRTSYQFTDRLLLRTIAEYNTFDRTLGGNLLFTYRVNAGTVFFIGYDDHYREGRRIDPLMHPTRALLRENRAFFTKLQYLFRY